MNPWLTRRVLNFAHQAGAKEAPSSTLYAMEKAIENGSDALELDVHRSKDNFLVVMHDEDVKATTNGSGFIRDLTLSELKKLDNAYNFSYPDSENNRSFPFRGYGPSDTRFTVALLEEVFQSFPDVFINLDIKEDLGYEKELYEIIMKNKMADNVIVASFHHSCLTRFRSIASFVATSASPVEVANLYQSFKQGISVVPPDFQLVQIPHFFSTQELVTKEFVQFLHANDLAVHVWTIDDPKEMEELINSGVDGIMTDCPSVLSEVLKKLNCSYLK